ncbi:MAG: hypothetical protein AAB676_09395 [Verrucomicrobiota bacterium]
MNARAVRIFHFLAVPWALTAPVLAGTNSAGPWVAASWILQEGQGDTLVDHSAHGNIEENDQDLARSGDGVSVPIAPLGIETLRVFLSR